MKSLGYECLYKSDNVSQYLSDLKIFGEVDFIYAFRATSLAMLETAEEKMVFNGDLKIRVLKPESLIAFKLQAVKNNPSRTSVDLQDIKKLAEINKRDMDCGLIDRYAELLNMEEVWHEIKKEVFP